MRTRKIIPRFRKSKRKFGGTKHLRNQRGGFISKILKYLSDLFQKIFNWTPKQSDKAVKIVREGVTNGQTINGISVNIGKEFNLSGHDTNTVKSVLNSVLPLELATAKYKEELTNKQKSLMEEQKTKTKTKTKNIVTNLKNKITLLYAEIDDNNKKIKENQAYLNDVTRTKTRKQKKDILTKISELEKTNKNNIDTITNIKKSVDNSNQHSEQ